MDEHEGMMKDALKKIDSTSFLMRQYSILDDPKVLLVLLKQTLEAVKKATQSYLQYERKWKRISMVPADFRSQLEMLRKKHTLEDDKLGMLQDLYEIVTKHKESDIEFSRKGEIFILERNLRINRISQKQVKGFLEHAKLIINQFNQLIHERST